MTRALLALQQPIALTEEQLTNRQPDPQEADEALFYVDEAGESAFDRSVAFFSSDILTQWGC